MVQLPQSGVDPVIHENEPAVTADPVDSNIFFALNVRSLPTGHFITKTKYLDDPEGNEIELYAGS